MNEHKQINYLKQFTIKMCHNINVIIIIIVFPINIMSQVIVVVVVVVIAAEAVVNIVIVINLILNYVNFCNNSDIKTSLKCRIQIINNKTP